MKKINWGMIVSHHPSCQCDRTYRMFGIRFCTRCTGIFLGVILSFIPLQYFLLEPNVLFILALIFPLPAILNFTLNELHKTKNNNIKRIITGFLLGCSLGYIFYCFFSEKTIFGLLVLGFILLLEFIVALILHKTGALEPFFKQYEDGFHKE